MKKQVTLDKNEYQQLVNIAALATKIIDSICYEENLKKKSVSHFVDTPECPKDIRVLYSSLLNLDDEISGDVVNELPSNYFETNIGEQSVLAPMDGVL